MSIRRRRLIRVGAFGGASATAQIRNLLFSEGEQGRIFYPKPMVDGEQVLWGMADGTVVVDTSDDPVGRMDDLSGNNGHATQATASRKPLYGMTGSVHRLDIDDVDDQLVCSKVTVNCSVLLLARRKGTADSVLLNNPGQNAEFIFVSQSGSSASLTGASGSPDTYIDGVVVTTRDESNTITSDLEWHIMEAVGVDFSSWANIGIGGYADASFRASFEVGGMVILEGEAATDRDAAREYLANLAGLTL